MTTKFHLPLPILNNSVQKPLMGLGKKEVHATYKRGGDAAEMIQSRVPKPEQRKVGVQEVGQDGNLVQF